jgi:hypothetical protein
MAYTLGEIVTKVQQRVRDTGYSSTEIKNYINDTQNDIFNEYRLPFMEATQPYTLTAGVSDITDGDGLPANYVQALDLLLTTDDRESRLLYRDIRDIDFNYPDADDTDAYAIGVPDSWYNYADTIRVFAVPDDAYTVSLRYYKKPTELSGDADVPEVPSEFGEILVVGAAYRVLQVKDNYDQAGILQNKYDELLQKLVSKYSYKQVGTVPRMRINRVRIGRSQF